MRGIERRIEAGLDPAVPSVASLFISRWDVAVADEVARRAAEPARDRRRQADLSRPTASCSTRIAGSAWRTRARGRSGCCWASTGTKDPDASDALYVEALAAPLTVNTMPEKTLLAFADHGEVGEPLPADGGDAEAVLAAFAEAGIDVDALAARLQQEGADAFVESWAELLESIAAEARPAGG